jgi:hypothetical protein
MSGFSQDAKSSAAKVSMAANKFFVVFMIVAFKLLKTVFMNTTHESYFTLTGMKKLFKNSSV